MGQSDFWHKTGIGQIIMAGLPGPDLDNGTRRLIEKFGVSNFILFSRNTGHGPGGLSRLCDHLKTLCVREGLSPLIAVDQEGGPVRRLQPPLFPDTASAAEIISSANPHKAMAKLAERTDAMLRDVGINMNLAPVLDLCLDAEKNVLKGRCFGAVPEQVAELGRIYIQTLQDSGILATAKHFPGIGRVKLDPHFERPVVKSSKKEIMSGLIPFREAVNTGVSAVMTSHVVFEAVDAARPATFSSEIAENLLRVDLGFKGVLLSDDLEMKGITGQAEVGAAAVEAFLAGHDILLICRKYDNIIDGLKGLRRAYQDGLIRKERLNLSLERIRSAAARADRQG